MPTIQVTECLICKATLGQESRDMDYRLCHTCRACTTCQQPLGPREIRACIKECEESFEGSLDNLAALLIHPRCDLLQRPNANQDPEVIIKQSYMDYLNNIRLLWEAEPDLSPETNEQSAAIACARLLVNQPLEKIYLNLSRMQAAVAHLAIALKTDRKNIKDVLDKREARKFEHARTEARVSARPTPKIDMDEAMIAEFMGRNGITDRSKAKQVLNKRKTAVQHFLKSGVDFDTAQEMVDKMMVANGTLLATDPRTAAEERQTNEPN